MPEPGAAHASGGRSASHRFGGTPARRSQFKWIVLLAAAVVLPTVSLLWFMSRAVANERLVIQQKLSALYGQTLEDAGIQAKRRIHTRLGAFSGVNRELDPYGLLRRLVLKEHFQGVVLWDRAGMPVYPGSGTPPGSTDASLEAPLAEAWQLEFAGGDYAGAAERYGQLATSGDPRALAGQVRCLAQSGRWADAVKAALAPPDSSAAPSRLLLLSLLQKAGRTEPQSGLITALDRDLFKTDADRLPAEQNLFIARKLLHVLAPDTPAYDQLSRLAEAEQLSIAAAETFPVPSGPVDTIVPATVGGERVYVIRHPAPLSGEMLIVMNHTGLASALDGYQTEFAGTDVHYRILDSRGNLIAGERGEGIPSIVSAPLPAGFPDGTVELFFMDGNMFDKAAGRQIAMYVWTGMLVILLMLAVGSFAVYAIGRQIRLNKMKNDFIATVSHELKTPLASMRLLVDTLLEGRTRDEEHAKQYLSMIARENERLTRMIENFLTFSRMERNKNAFALTAAAPREILEAAVEAVCTKYEANGCRLSIRAGDVPDIAADRDAITTVLINLLDNACKYTADDKRIELALFADAGDVCFSVSDNGIGLTRRQIRRIFDSFYQVDSSLARTTEGCGLGLSIVRFIVNAHKGRIDVESRPGEGSTFTVRLPVARQNGIHAQNGNNTDC